MLMKEKNILLANEENRMPYPLETEQELYRAISSGDQETAQMQLNQLLSHVYYYAGDDEEFNVRIMELLIIMIRAAAAGGMEINHALEMSKEYINKLHSMNNNEDITDWLSDNLKVLMNEVFSLEAERHSASMLKAIGYMKRNFARKLSLEEVADHAGYSPAYFSRIFREDTGMAHSDYLNLLRVEKGKTLLHSTKLKMTEIGAMLGFSDQSHFTRTFKKLTGITPDQYRKNS